MPTTTRTKLSHLATAPRAFWTIAGVPNPDTVGDHAFRAALIAECLAFASGDSAPGIEARGALGAVLQRVEVGDYPSSTAPRPSFIRALAEQTTPTVPVVTLKDGAHFADTSGFLETIFQAHEYERLGAVPGTVMPDLRIPSPAPALVASMVDYVASLAGAIQFDWSPATIIADFYEAPDYYHQMLMFTKLYGNVRTELLDQSIKDSVLIIDRHLDVLDVGCGVANLGYNLASRASSAALSRLDVNKDALRSIRTGRISNVTIRNYLADFGKRWPIPTGTQDVVMLGEVLEHAFNPEWLLQEANRVLRSGGKVIITVPNAWHWNKVLRFLFRGRLERTLASDHIRYFSSRTLKESLLRNGFVADRFRRFSLKWRAADTFSGKLQRLYTRWVPGCARNYFVVAAREAQCTSNGMSTDDDTAALVDFFIAANRAKRLPYTIDNTLTVAQTSFLVTMLALSVAARSTLRSDLLVFSSIARGLIEANIAEYPVRVRMALTDSNHLELLAGSLSAMPPTYSTPLKAAVQNAITSPEWLVINAMFQLEYSAGVDKQCLNILPDDIRTLIAETYT